jgi:hypothetical protein
MTISFKQLKDPMTGEVSDKQIQYTDEAGTVWTVPLGAGHRFEAEYEAWVAAGNTAEAPD